VQQTENVKFKLLLVNFHFLLGDLAMLEKQPQECPD